MSNTPVAGAGHSDHHRGDRLRKFLLPDGRRVHVVSSPEEAEKLKRKLSAVEPQEDFDLYIQGTPEHLEALREAHKHHNERQQDLRDRHGPIFEDIDGVRTELDALSKELMTMTDQSIDLDANFSKYGYAAHLRTRDDHGSGSSTPRSRQGSDTPKSAKDWESERRTKKPIKLVKMPVVRQYFHKGLLWRSSTMEEVASFELFVDLLYVGIIAINGDQASEAATGLSLLRFCITFILSWKIWSDFTIVVSWFETDDVLQRVCVLFDMACLFGLTTNMTSAFETTYSQMVAFYLGARLFLASYYFSIAYFVPMVRAAMASHAVWIVIPSILWIGSIYIGEPKRYAIIWVALFIDLFGSTTVIFATRSFSFMPAWWTEKMSKWFDFYPALNIEHRTERTNAFVTLVFGYSVVSLLYQNKAPFGLNAIFGKAILGLVQAFAFNWMYFEIDGADLFVHAIRRHAGSAMLWNSIHLPFIMSFVLAAASLSRLVVAHDCGNASIESLTALYAAKSEGEISHGLRWYYCAGISIALACMGVISLTHVHKELPTERIKKSHRLVLRFVVSIVVMALGVADHLNSLQLIGTTTSLVCLTLAMDLYGSSCSTQSLWGLSGQCSYSAECFVKRRDIEEAAKQGIKVNLEEVAKEQKKEQNINYMT